MCHLMQGKDSLSDFCINFKSSKIHKTVPTWEELGGIIINKEEICTQFRAGEDLNLCGWGLYTHIRPTKLGFLSLEQTLPQAS